MLVVYIILLSERGSERWSRGIRWDVERTRFGMLIAHSQRERGNTRKQTGRFWSNLNCKFEFFLAEKRIEPPLQTGIIGVVGTTAAPTNRFVETV